MKLDIHNTEHKSGASIRQWEENSIVLPILPRAGLGNMMLVWAQASVFAKLNQIPMIEPFWHPIRLGPWLRGEKDKRYYGNTFISSSLFEQAKVSTTAKLKLATLHYNLPVKKLDSSFFLENKSSKRIFVFNDFPQWQDYFGNIREENQFIRDKLIKQIHPRKRQEILERQPPNIGIHIRLGDYTEPKPSADFSIDRNTRTPLDWYVRVLQSLRALLGYPVQATVFSDGRENELKQILDLENVELSKNESALSDMLTLSRGSILISSSHSTFSGWASFLGQMPTIRYPERSKLYKPIFSSDTREKIFEGAYDPKNISMPYLLKENLLGRLSR